MKIKILKFSGDYGHDYEDHDILQGVTDWEECTDNEYYDILSWINEKNKRTRSSSSCKEFWIVFQQPEPARTVPDTLKEFKEMMKNDKEKQKKAKLAADKRKATIKKNKEAKEREQLERLQEKYSDKS